MAQISTADFRTGMTIDISEGLFQISDFQHVKPGKGGAFVRTTLKNVRTGAVLDKTFRAGEKMERAIVEKTEMQYLYNDGTNFVFMNTDTYEQLEIAPETLGGTVDYLIETNSAHILFYGDEIIGVDLPASVVMEITETEPGIQGDRVSGARKPATVQTGLVVQVPLFVEQGEKIKVDTRSGDYLERAN